MASSDSSSRARLTESRRWVVKIGSALLTNDGRGLDVASISSWVDQMAALQKQGLEVVLVSSGSVAEGMSRLGMTERPQHVHLLQAAAAVGQTGLVQAYETFFHKHNLHTAQILLTHDDLSDRKRYLNARSTIRTLLQMGVVPIINENDTVVTDEIRFGDNDTLGALVANLMEADALVILTDQLGMFSKDPRHHADAELVHEAYAADPSLDVMVGGSAGSLGRGGMLTKLRAGRLAARSGASTVIVGGRIPDVLLRLRQGEELGTLLLSEQGRWASRKQWLAGHLKTKGTLVLDAGAVQVLSQKGTSLLPVGVKSIAGNFRRGEIVTCVDESGREVARGLVNYDAADARLIIGKCSDSIVSVLGYSHEPELVHRDNLILV